jgi:ribosomal protein S18 acetylase RimI-like enzyme
MDITFYKKDEIPEKLENLTILLKRSFDTIDLVDDVIIGLLEEKEIIGAVCLLPNHKDLTDDDCYLYNFCIREEDRGKGYGKRLLAEAEKYIKKNIYLFVKKENVPAIRLYNKCKYSVHQANPTGFIMKKIYTKTYNEH